MSWFTEQHHQGVSALTKHLEHTRQTCRKCGFDDYVLHSEWKAHVETTPKSGHIRYRLTCPDCHSTEIVELDV
jgi:ribosomal protein S27AE